MKRQELTNSELKFAELIWDNAPLATMELVRLSETAMGWKKSTIFSMLKILCEKGILKHEHPLVSVVMTKDEYLARQSRRIINGNPLAVGEGGTKARIKNILNFNRPSRIIILVAVLMVAGLSGCLALNQINYDNWETYAFPAEEFAAISFRTERMEYNPDFTAIHACLTNENAASEVMCGDYFRLMYQDGDTWRVVPFRDGISFNDIGWLLEPGDSKTFTLTHGMSKSKLRPGQYRMVTEIWFDNAVGERETKTVWAEFRIDRTVIIPDADLPKADDVTSVEIQLYNHGEAPDAVIIADQARIDFILGELSSGQKTMDQSIHDAPAVSNYLAFNIQIADRTRRLFLYAENDKYYIEEPYIGIYKTDKIVYQALYAVYDAATMSTEPLPNLATLERIQPGMTIDEVHSILGDPHAQLHGMWGDVYALVNGNQAYIYYDNSGTVQEIRLHVSEDWMGNFDGKIMSIDDLRTLADRGDELRFEDFVEFRSMNVSSNLERYIMLYDINAPYRLIVGAAGIGKPDRVTLEGIWDDGRNGIDLRYGDLETFIHDRPIYMYLKEGTLSPTEATFILQNLTDRDYLYGELFTLQRKTENGWVELETIIENYAFLLLGMELPPNQSKEITVTWNWLYGTLAPGDYRICKEASHIRSPGDYENYSLYAAFTVDE